MCGIFFSIVNEQNEIVQQEFHRNHIEALLRNRGPDYSSVIKNVLNGKCLLFHCTILHHQGNAIFSQPVEKDNFTLLFNGDLYGMDGMESGQSDTEFLCNLIQEAKDEENLLNILTSLTGPFSLLCKFGSKIFFARDGLGRNSLLIGKQKHSEMFFISSAIDPSMINDEIEVIELPPLGVYVMSLNSDMTNVIQLHPYKSLNEHIYYQQQHEMINNIIGTDICSILNTPKIPQKKFNFDFVELCKDNSDEVCDIFDSLLKHPEVVEVVETFIKLLSNSVKDRVSQIQNRCKICMKTSTNANVGDKCLHSKIGILFSGGVDCTLISILADKFIPENETIDLMNVSFEKVTNKGENVDWNVPDRITGLATVEELKNLSPTRCWNFLEINITRQELKENLPKLSSLVYPLSNVLDESLGAALYFASRGIGRDYESQCRVVLMGSGADELFGGYTRHRNAFKRSSDSCDLLTEELTLDWVRLPSRNLARDDRVIGDNGITVRAPFIEENFVSFAQSLKSTQRCNPSLAEGIGDKLLLRLCAYRLGLKSCCVYKKRALQFGSRIADKRQKATDKSDALVITKQ